MQYYYTIESKINLDKIQNECENLASRESPCKHNRSLNNIKLISNTLFFH